ncbi:MAG: hypothetical protein NVS4B11_28370 [Ktedonobacteraceae bacterium]
MAYQPGWSVVAQTVVRRERWPGGYRGGSLARSIPLVYIGQEVQPDRPVLRMEPRGAIGGFSQNEIVPAGVYGHVVDITPRGGIVIEGQVAIVRGVIGAGNQVAGVLNIVQGNTLSRQLPAGAILVVSGSLTFAMLRQALLAGVTGIVAGSVAIRDFEGFLRTDLIQLLNDIDVEQAQANLPAMTVLCTEGLGAATMAEHVLHVLRQHQGSVVLLSGITSTRWGIQPELIIPFSPEEIQHYWHPVQQDLSLTLGAQVRVCGGEHEGATGKIEYIFAYAQVFPSGVRSRAIRLRLDSGSFLVIPVMLAQRIG